MPFSDPLKQKEYEKSYRIKNKEKIQSQRKHEKAISCAT
jgi:hypothetical protein